MAWHVLLLLSCNTGGCGPEALPGGANTPACSCEFRVISWGHDLTLIPTESWGKDSQGPTSRTVPWCSCCSRAIQASRDRRKPYLWRCVLGSDDQKFYPCTFAAFLSTCNPLKIPRRFWFLNAVSLMIFSRDKYFINNGTTVWDVVTFIYRDFSIPTLHLFKGIIFVEPDGISGIPEGYGLISLFSEHRPKEIKCILHWHNK